jgi:rhodanese-related sulfurtransferase
MWGVPCRSGHRYTIAAPILTAHGGPAVGVNDGLDNAETAGRPIDKGGTP